MALSLLFILAFNAAAGGQKEEKALSEETVSWLKSAKLGKYAEEKFDEEALYAAAKEEGEVNVFDIDSPEIVTEVLAEQNAENYVADVMHELYDRNLVFGYVPPDLKGLIPENFRKSLLVHHTSLYAFIYNDDKMSAPPFDSLWDLTKEEWKGRFFFPDPQKMSEFVEVLAAVIGHSKEMESEYKRVFGEKLKLSPGVENAGYEWILRILKNDAVIMGSTNDVAKAVGLSDQADPPVGLTAFSRLRDKEKNPNLKFDIMYNVKPVMGFSTDVVIAIANQAKHPNAAKLLIRWMMGDEKGGTGYVPYYVLGNFSVRTDVPPVKGARKLSDLNLWASDPEFVWENGLKILEFWVTNWN